MYLFILFSLHSVNLVRP